MADAERAPAFTSLVCAAPRRKRFSALAELASLAATGGLLWIASRVSLALHLAPAWFFVEALGYACLAWLWSAAITTGLYLAVPRLQLEELAQYVPRTASVAVWFAPATILLAYASPGALLAALVLVVNATRLLYSQWTESDRAEDANGLPQYASRSEIFTGVIRTRPLRRELLSAIAAAVALEGGIAAVLLRRPLTSAGLLAMGTAMITLLVLSAGLWKPARPASLPRTLTGIASTVLLAAFLTSGGMAIRALRTPVGIPGSGSAGNSAANPGPLDSIRAVVRETLYKDPASKAAGGASGAQRPPEAAPVGLDDGSYPGVILWPEVKPVTVLIAPLPAGGRSFAGSRNPLSIPFGGEYWMYRAPYSRPPMGSYFQRASPARLTFRTIDGRPLHMEARQKLEQSIELSCCAEMQVAIRNAETRRGSITLELFLIDSESRRVRARSLGREPVLSTPASQDAPVGEILHFAISPAPDLRKFDQFRIVVHRAANLGDRSARIAIERFVLIPRG